MKNIKTIIASNLLYYVLLQVAVVAALSHPALESHRAALASSVGISSADLWMPAAGILIVATFFLLRALLVNVADPVRDLASQTKISKRRFAFQKRSRNWEEDILKHYIEAQAIRTEELEHQVEDMEGDHAALARDVERAQAKVEAAEKQVEAVNRMRQELSIENETLKAAKQSLLHAVESERKARVGREIERRSDEIYSQMERAVSAVAYKSAWLPSIMNELKTPAVVINSLSSQMVENFTDASLSRLKATLTEIRHHSDSQLHRIKSILSRDAAPDSAEPVAVLEPITVPPPPVLKFEAPPPAHVNGANAANGANGADYPALSPNRSQPRAEAAPDVATPPAPQMLTEVIERSVAHCAEISPNVIIDFEIEEGLEAEIEDKTFESSLTWMLTLACARLEEGRVTLFAHSEDEYIDLQVIPRGAQRSSQNLDLGLISRATSALAGKVIIDDDKPHEMSLRFKTELDSVGTREVLVV